MTTDGPAGPPVEADASQPYVHAPTQRPVPAGEGEAAARYVHAPTHGALDLPDGPYAHAPNSARLREPGSPPSQSTMDHTLPAADELEPEADDELEPEADDDRGLGAEPVTEDAFRVGAGPLTGDALRVGAEPVAGDVVRVDAEPVTEDAFRVGAGPLTGDALRVGAEPAAAASLGAPSQWTAAVGPPPPPGPRFAPQPEPYEPPPARRFDPARWLRSLAGVDERLLRSVWFERARHTALGGIILGTGLIAGLSMWTALNAAFGYESLLHLVPALIWLIFIISLDRALVSTMFGAGRRWGAFLLRLALAVMFGFIIAEPLTIRIFQTAIEEHIRGERTQELADLQSTLLGCNSKEVATGTAPAAQGCEDYLLSFDRTPIAAEAELAARQQDEARLAETVAADNAELARLTEAARQECAGTSGVGLTGLRGYGPECRDRNRDVVNFTTTHPMEANANRLATVRTEIATLAAEVADSQAAFEQTRDEQIAARVEEVRSHQGAIGLLERMNALHELASTSLALFLGTWAVRLFFVLADCLPVVVKFSGGASEYDRILRAQAVGSVRRHAQEMDIIRAEGDHHVRRHHADLDLELQEHRAEASLRRGDAVRRVSDRLLNPRR